VKRRPLRPEEAELWARVIEDATPLIRTAPTPAPTAQVPDPVASPPPPAQLAPRAEPHRPALRPKAVAPAAGVHMDHKTYQRLRRGKLEPEARIDLHGMIQAEAHEALLGFVTRSFLHGRRLILVITGKGGRDHGVLRRAVPQWLSLPPLRPMVLQVAEAHVAHGGAGALYVYLRRGA